MSERYIKRIHSGPCSVCGGRDFASVNGTNYYCAACHPPDQGARVIHKGKFDAHEKVRQILARRGPSGAANHEDLPEIEKLLKPGAPQRLELGTLEDQLRQARAKAQGRV